MLQSVGIPLYELDNEIAGPLSFANSGGSSVRAVHAKLLYAVWMSQGRMLGEEVSHLLIELDEVLLDQSQFFQCQLPQSTIHGMQRRARAQGVGQLRGCRAETLTRRGGGLVNLLWPPS